MRSVLLCAVAASVLSLAGVAAAEESAPAAAAASVDVKPGQWIYTSDGMAVGRVDVVDKDKTGKAETAGVIRDMRMVHIPVSTLSTGPKGLVTSLTRKDVDR
jgi:hypothetical protein